MMHRTVPGCRSNCGGQAWPGQATGSSAATRLIAKHFPGGQILSARHCDSPLERPTRPSGRFRTLTVSDPFRSSPKIQPAFNTHRPTLWAAVLSNPFLAQRRGDDPFECFPSASRRDADLKILCIMPSSGLRSIAPQGPTLSLIAFAVLVENWRGVHVIRGGGSRCVRSHSKLSLLLYSALMGQWRYSLMTDKLTETMQVAKRVYSLAQEQDDPALMMGRLPGFWYPRSTFLGDFRVGTTIRLAWGFRSGAREGVRSPVEEVDPPAVVCLCL